MVAGRFQQIKTGIRCKVVNTLCEQISIGALLSEKGYDGNRRRRKGTDCRLESILPIFNQLVSTQSAFFSSGKKVEVKSGESAESENSTRNTVMAIGQFNF